MDMVINMANIIDKIFEYSLEEIMGKLSDNVEIGSQENIKR